MRRSDLADDAVLLGAASQEPDAFAIFYVRYAEQVFAFFVSRIRRPDLAADLTAETFAAALEGAARFRGTDSAAPWLFQIARHKMLDAFRRKRVDDAARRALGMQPIEIDADDLEDLERRLDLAAHEAWLADALASLPAEQREAVLARVVDEREYEEIATEVVCSEALIRQRVSRGLASLRARFSDEQ